MKPSNNKESEDRSKLLRQAAIFATIPFVMAVPPILGWVIGQALDSWLGTGPWVMFTLLTAGFVSGIREVYRIIKKYGDGT